jgi:hypothetical protein
MAKSFSAFKEWCKYVIGYAGLKVLSRRFPVLDSENRTKSLITEINAKSLILTFLLLIFLLSLAF